MIITLKGADFSADNIGQVELERTLNAYTLAAIEASGNAHLTESQKLALDDLFLAMGVDGSNNVMSKMHKVYLPIIAGDVTKALINYKNNSFVADMSLDASHWQLRSHGLVGLSSGQEITLTENDRIVGNDFCEFFLRSEKMVRGVDDSSFIFSLRGVSNSGLFLGMRQASASANEGISGGDYGTNWGFFIDKLEDSLKASGVNSTNVGYNLNVQGSWVDSSSPFVFDPGMSEETQQTLYVFGLASTQLTKPYAVAMYGESVTEAQAKDICEKIDALYDTFVS